MKYLTKTRSYWYKTHINAEIGKQKWSNYWAERGYMIIDAQTAYLHKKLGDKEKQYKLVITFRENV
jgi:hypothetical protein